MRTADVTEEAYREFHSTKERVTIHKYGELASISEPWEKMTLLVSWRYCEKNKNASPSKNLYSRLKKKREGF